MFSLLDLMIGVALVVMCVAGFFYLNELDNRRYRNFDNGGIKV